MYCVRANVKNEFRFFFNVFFTDRKMGLGEREREYRNKRRKGKGN